MAAAQPGVSADAADAADAAGVSVGDEELVDSQSIGDSDEGRLEHAFALQSGDTLASVRPNRYGTRELVGLLERAADNVARSFPASRLAVGDLSSENGGPLAPHGSHQSGRDADVGFYVLDANGERALQAIFGDIAADGTGRHGTVRFDDARNWALLVALVDDPMAEVQHVLIVDHLRQRLLDYAHAIEAPEDQIRRVELVTRHIRGSENHDDHFHVRIYCSVGDRPACLDRPPLHPWYYGTPSPQAVEAARVADLMRAAAMRRMQAQERASAASLAHDHAQVMATQEVWARALAAESTRQREAERRRAARLSREERLAVLEARRREAELIRQAARAAADERGRAAELSADERRWRAGERRRAERLRAQQRRAQEDERRRAASLRRQDDRARRMIQRAEQQRARDRRRALELLRDGERLRQQLN